MPFGCSQNGVNVCEIGPKLLSQTVVPVGSNEPTDSQLALITGSSQNSGTSLIEGGHTVETTQPRLADTLDGYLYVGGLVVMVTVLAAVEPSASFRVISLGALSPSALSAVSPSHIGVVLVSYLLQRRRADCF